MLQKRIIPCLQLFNESLVKTVKFKNYKYIGDPVNTVRIFNELEVDELCFLDIRASKNKYHPNLELLQEIAMWLMAKRKVQSWNFWIFAKNTMLYF